MNNDRMSLRDLMDQPFGAWIFASFGLGLCVLCGGLGLAAGMLLSERASFVAFGIAFVGGLGALEWHRILMRKAHETFQAESRDMLGRIDAALVEFGKKLDQ